jgi:hypothetical protein
MTGTIIPLRSGREKASALATFDAAAAALLASGRATTLSGAQRDAILTSLLEQRGKLVAVIADLRARPPSEDDRINTINADLRDNATEGLAQIDQLIQHVDAYTTSSQRYGAIG